MGPWPTRRHENQRRRPRESGDPFSLKRIQALAGMTRSSGELDKLEAYLGARKNSHDGGSAVTTESTYRKRATVGATP